MFCVDENERKTEVQKRREKNKLDEAKSEYEW